MNKLYIAALLAAAPLALAAGSATARPLTIDDVIQLSRVSAPAASPDGHWLVWQQRETDLSIDGGRFDLWRLDLSRRGAAPERLVAEATVDETAPAFSADGATVYFQSDKGGSAQVWAVPVTGGAPRQLTHVTGGFSGFEVAPTGDRIAIWADRLPGAATLASTAPPAPANAGNGRTYDQLFVRHWASWSDGTRSQIFVLPMTSDGSTGDGQGVNVTRPLIGDTPSKPFGGGEEIAWSRDGRTLYFALREAGRIEPLSTNLDVFAVPADGSAAPTNLTDANDATDTLPAVSPDGHTLAYVAMARPRYESDRQVIQLRDLATGQTRVLTQDWDRSVASLAWSADGRSLLVTAEDHYDNAAWRVDAASGRVIRLTGPGSVSALVPLARGGAVIALNSLTAPDDFYRIGARGGPLARLTSVNAQRLAGIDMPLATRFSFPCANNDTCWGYALRPPQLAAGQRAPIAFVVHGGPQGTIGNAWSYRWNEAVFAGAGYGTVFVDFHGSTGYGQAFTDGINRNWGGWPLQDLQAGLAAATQRFPWLDGNNACALGASYGGYMMNWIEGQWPDRFRCIVQHDGVFDARAMAYETEELWFDEWEHGGHPYFATPDEYERWNPVNHVAAWRTPQLVITSEGDYRIPYTQGIAAFTALQRREIPSRLMVFPGGSHWVTKPRESRQWWGEVLGWLGRWTGKGAN